MKSLRAYRRNSIYCRRDAALISTTSVLVRQTLSDVAIAFISAQNRCAVNRL
jgi:hypothetical protein